MTIQLCLAKDLIATMPASPTHLFERRRPRIPRLNRPPTVIFPIVLQRQNSLYLLDVMSSRRSEKLGAIIDECPEPRRKQFPVRVEETDLNLVVGCRAQRQDMRKAPGFDILTHH